MKRQPPAFTWQPIETMPEARIVEVMRVGGETRLAARLRIPESRVGVSGSILKVAAWVCIADVLRHEEIKDAIAWRDVPGSEPLPTGGSITDETEELIAA